MDAMTFPSGLPTLRLPALDPTHYTALHALDYGSLYSPDGREHVINAETPVVVTWHPSATAADPTVSNASLPGTGSSGSSWFGLPSLPKNLGARLAIAVLAIGLLLLVAWRLSK